MIQAKVGILLTNIGTPTAPTTPAVRHFLNKFLSDPRVVELPRILWWPILHGFILRFRPKCSAKLYQQIWTEQGSPLLVYSQKIAEKLQNQLQLPVVLGLHYSTPSIENALETLRKKAVTKILILPLYPQYSATTTASTFDLVSNTLKKWRTLPEIRTINQYAAHPNYIKAVSTSIRKTWEQKGQAQHLLFSFHGIPQRYADAGDPYPALCRHTAQLIAKELQLSATRWTVAFQSRLGRGGWLMPYTDISLQSFPQLGVTDLHVICPGFATDCLETLEEIAIRGKKQFSRAGGKSLYYIPALNDGDEHIEMFMKIIRSNLQGWI